MWDDAEGKDSQPIKIGKPVFADGVEVRATVYPPDGDSILQAQVIFDVGRVHMSIYPSAAELRAVAAKLLETADVFDRLAAE